MFSYLFSASKKPVAEPVAEAVPEAVQNTLAADGPSPNQSIADGPSPNQSIADNEQLKAQIQVLLAEKAALEKLVEHLRRDSAVYRDLMFTKVCNCNN